MLQSHDSVSFTQCLLSLQITEWYATLLYRPHFNRNSLPGLSRQRRVISLHKSNENESRGSDSAYRWRR